MAAITRFLLFLLGAVTFGFCLLLYEDQERRIQNRLEDWWIKLDDVRIRSLATEGLFVARASSLMSRLLDEVFGADLLSIRLFVVSVVLSMLTISLFEVVEVILFGRVGVRKVDVGRFVFLVKDVGYDFVAIPTLLFLIKRHRIIALIGTVCYLAFSAFYQGFYNSEIAAHPTPYIVGILIGSCCSVATDIAGLFVLRKMLRAIAVLTNAHQIVMIAVGSLAMGIFLWVSPILLLFLLFARMGASASVLIKSNFFVGYIESAVTMNVTDALVLFFVFLFMIILALHHLAWPSLQRPIYTLQKSGITSRKAMIPVSLTLMYMGAGLDKGWLLPVWEAIKKAFGG